MKKVQRLVLALMLSMGSMQYAQAQSATAADKVSLVIPADPGNTAVQRQTSGTYLDLPLPGEKKFKGKINYNKSRPDGKQNLAGTIDGISGSTFYLRLDKGAIEGNIVLKEGKKAYSYYSNENGTYVKEVAIESVLCIEYEAEPVKAKAAPAAPSYIAPATLKLQSLPGAKGCVLLDFDGQYVAGTPWNGGQPISALPAGFTEAEIRETYDIVKEDFLPFNLNITTDSTVFFSYPQEFRMRAIITPTTTAAPGSGGVAFIGSFKWADETPCWVFNLGAKNAGETISHEIGHTFSLLHDGRDGFAPNVHEEYYYGNGIWAPIMGASFSPVTTQWSKGDYQYANNQEDDLAIIAGYTNGIGYRNDDHGNTKPTATPLRKDASGNLFPENNHGVIEKAGDFDYFSFTPAVTGYVFINIRPAERHANLNIFGRLIRPDGSSFNSDMSGTWSGLTQVHVMAGQTYHVEVSAVQLGSPLNDGVTFAYGHSVYGSKGRYTISGNINPGAWTSDVAATFYKDCSYGGSTSGIAAGSYTTYDLDWLSILNDDVSSLKVTPGYTVVLYENDNYTGNSVSFTADDNCLTDNNFNEKVSSVRIFPSGNRLPEVALSAPANGDVIYTPATIVLKANPSDEDGMITKVEFYNGATKLGQATAAPYNYTWSSVAAGAYTLKAVVTDNSGGQTTSNLSAITVAAYAAKATFYPNASYSGTATGLAPGTYNLSALNAKGIANDDIASVQVSSGYEVILFKDDNAYGDAKKISTNTASLTAAGFENVVSSLVVRPVTANVAPDVTLTSPYDSTVLTDVIGFTLSASAHDQDGSVSYIQYYDGATLLATTYPPYFNHYWEPAVGTHVVTAKAFDNDGASRVSKSAVLIKQGSACTTPAWATNTTYVSGNKAEQGGIRYIANFWNYNQPPNVNNGPSGSGKPWTSLGSCNSRETAETGFVAAEKSSTLNIYPNPATEKVNLTFETKDEGDITVEVFDLLSRNVITQKVHRTAGLNTIELDVTTLAKGIYAVDISSGEERISAKLVIK